MKKLKKIISCAIIASMITTTFSPIQVLATENTEDFILSSQVENEDEQTAGFDKTVHGEVVQDGLCGQDGDNVQYKLYEDGMMYIYGYGTIGDFDFCNIFNLSKVYIKNGVTGIGYSAFYGCNELKTIEIPDSIKTIGDCAFRNCKKLTCADLPDKIESIGDYAFGYCISLEQIKIPSATDNISNSAFGDVVVLKV